MSTPNAPWTVRIFELLADGPRPLEFLIAEVRNMVPPGRAYRQAEKKRKSQQRRRVNKTDRHPVVRKATEDETIRTGQRQIVMDSVTALVGRGRLEYVEGEAGRYVQLGRERAVSGMLASPKLQKLYEHEPSFTKRRIDGVKNPSGRPIDAVDIECSCGWTWSGAQQDPDGDWHIHATSKDQAKIQFTKHRRSFV